MVCQKKGMDLVTTIGVIILLLVTLFVILMSFTSIFGEQRDILGIFVQSNNVFSISNECELACLDGLKDKFCVNMTSKPLRLGDGRSIKGSCAAISEVGAIGSFDGIKKCSKFNCEEVKPAVCYKGWNNYDCKTWSSKVES